MKNLIVMIYESSNGMIQVLNLASIMFNKRILIVKIECAIFIKIGLIRISDTDQMSIGGKSPRSLVTTYNGR